MRRKILRWTAAAVLVLVGVACPATGIAMASARGAQVQAQADSPALRDLDREFVKVIRFANLWEIPMGELAEKRGTTQKVRDVGLTIANDHKKLNAAVEQLARRLGLTLPDQPTSSQKSWMADISGRHGDDFDRTFADRLRAAHGTVFGLVAEVRAGTRNPDVRAFAQTANEIVMKHMALLESTGNVSDAGMFAEAAARKASSPENTISHGDLVMTVLVGLAVAVATIGVVRLFSARGAAE